MGIKGLGSFQHRREGVQIVLVRINGKTVKRELLVHSDEARDIAFP